MSKLVRTRFAPSPTGYLHVGGLRTALFNYLLARKFGGKFILRIEDTDQTRYVPGAETDIIDSLHWAGLTWDEGPKKGGDSGPYVQSERSDIYRQKTQELLDSFQSYHCFCSAEVLDKMRQTQREKHLPPRYDRRCLSLSKQDVQKKLAAGEKYVVRYKVPQIGIVECVDVVRGKVSFKSDEIDDFVLLKSDGMPTYHLANVVDDYLMKISHVIRGEEWLPSLPKHILLYKAFGWAEFMPKFVHLPLLLSKDRKKLSKRQGGVAVKDYRDKGYLPEALLNFVLLLGWNPGDDREIFSTEEMEKTFALDLINKSGAVFDLDKLDWMNAHYIKEKDLDELVGLCAGFWEENKIIKIVSDDKYEIKDSGRQVDKGYLRSIVEIERERIKTLSDIADPEKTGFFFKENLVYEAHLLLWKKTTAEQTRQYLEESFSVMEKIALDEFNRQNLRELFVEYINTEGLKTGEVLWPLRVALTGLKGSPDPFSVADIIGKDICLQRLKQSIDKL